MGGAIGFIPFLFFFLKGAIIEGNQDGIGLGQITCVCYGIFSSVLEQRSKVD